MANPKDLYYDSNKRKKLWDKIKSSASKGLAGLVIATTLFLGSGKNAKADLIPIKTAEAVVPNAANYDGESIKYSGTLTENGKTPTKRYVLWGVKRGAIAGGVANNPRGPPGIPISHIAGFFNKDDPNWYGLLEGETPDYWFGGRDLDGDDIIGWYDPDNSVIYFDYSDEYGSEYIPPEEIQVLYFSPFMSENPGRVDINIIPEPSALLLTTPAFGLLLRKKKKSKDKKNKN